jgi:uncharacterized membrane protein YqjE
MLIAYGIIGTLTTIIGVLAIQYEKFRTIASMDKYMFSLSISFFSFLMNSIIVNLDFPKKFSFPLVFIFNYLLIASVTYLYINYSKLFKDVLGNNLTRQHAYNWIKDVLKEMKQNRNFIFFHAFAISSAFLLLNNVTYSNYILISYNFLLMRTILFANIDGIKRNMINHIIERKSITLYNSNSELKEVANTNCLEQIINPLMEQIQNTVKKPKNNPIIMENFYLRVLPNEKIDNIIIEFIQNSCDIILQNTNNDTILLAFKVRNEQDLKNFYIQHYEKYIKTFKKNTYLDVTTDQKKYNKINKPVVEKFLQNEKNKRMMISLLSNNFYYIYSSEYDDFLKKNIEFFSRNNELLFPYSTKSETIELNITNNPEHKTVYVGTYTIDNNNNKIPHGTGFLYNICNEKDINLEGRVTYLYGVVVKLEFINEDFFFPTINSTNGLMTDEFGHLVIYPITKKCLVDSYKKLYPDNLEETNFEETLENYLASDKVVEERIQETLESNTAYTALNSGLKWYGFFAGLFFVGVSVVSTNPVVGVPLLAMSFWSNIVAANIIAKGDAEIGFDDVHNLNLICDINKNDCGVSKNNNLKIKLIQKKYTDILKKTLSINSEDNTYKNISKDFSFDELFCDFSCTSHAIYLFQYMNFENINNYDILSFYYKEKINFQCSIENLKWNEIYKVLRKNLEGKKICLWNKSEEDMFNNVRQSLLTFFQFKNNSEKFNYDSDIFITEIPNVNSNDDKDTDINIPVGDNIVSLSLFDILLHLIFFNFIKPYTKYKGDETDNFKKFNVCMSTLISIMLLLIYLHNLDITDSAQSDSYQIELSQLKKSKETEYYKNDYTPYTKKINDNVQSIKTNIRNLIKKINGNPEIGELYDIKNMINLDNTYLKLSKNGLELLSGTIFSKTEIYDNYKNNYAIVESIVFFGNQQKPILQSKNVFYINMQFFLNNAEKVVNVKDKLCDRIEFYDKDNETNLNTDKKSLKNMFNQDAWKNNPYLVRINYSDYSDLDGNLFSNSNQSYFNILFNESTIKNICDKLQEIKLFSNSLFMYKNVKSNCDSDTYRIIDDKKMVKEAVSENICILKYTPDYLKQDVDVLYNLFSSETNIKSEKEKFWTMNIKKNQELMKKLLQKNGLFIQYDKWDINNDESFVCIAVNDNGLALQFASDELKNDKTIVCKAVQQNGLALQFASVEFKEDKTYKTVVCKAVQQNGLALQFASVDLKNDKTVVCKAVQQNGLALQFASVDLKNDKTVVCKAVQQNGLALQFASIELKNDKTVVFKAVQQNGLALQFASVELKNDNTVVCKAVQQNGLALQYAGENFWKTNVDWIKKQIIEDGTLFVFHNIKEEYITAFYSSYFDQYQLTGKNKVDIKPLITDEQLKKLFKVSMSIYQLKELKELKESKENLIKWYRRIGKFTDPEFIEYAVTIDAMLLNEYFDNSYSPGSEWISTKVTEMVNYIDILKNAAIQNINIIKEKKLTNDLDNDQLMQILQEPIKQNSKEVMEILSNYFLDNNYHLLLDNLINPAIKSNWESLEYIMKTIKWYVGKSVFILEDEVNLWDPVYMAVNENFSAIQYIKDYKLLIININ